MEVKGWTLEELAKELKLSKNSTQKRVEREGIEPIFNGSIYPPDTYKRIKEAKPGRPPKNPAPETSKKSRKSNA
jgi:hypothetical protein